MDGARFCPVCGADLGTARGFVQEYWSATEQNFVLWCPGCRRMATVTLAEHVVLTEPEH